jgi:hypothetical protein
VWQLLISSATELIGGHFKRKSEEKQAQHERKLETIKHEANWDNIQATNSGTSWKDEWFTVLFSVPLIMAFVPEMVQIVRDGFEVLEQMPDWYKGFLGAAVAASGSNATIDVTYYNAASSSTLLLFDDYTISSKAFFEVGGNFNEFLIMGEGDYIQVSSTHSCTFIVSVVEYDNQFKNL